MEEASINRMFVALATVAAHCSLLSANIELEGKVDSQERNREGG